MISSITRRWRRHCLTAAAAGASVLLGAPLVSASPRTFLVRDAAGKGLSGAFAACVSVRRGAAGVESAATASSDDGGRVSLAQAPPSCFAVASLPGYGPTLLEQVQHPRPVSDNEVVLAVSTSPAARLGLALQGLKPGGLYQALLKRGPRLTPAAFGLLRATDTAGVVYLDGVPQAPGGTYVFSVTAPDGGVLEDVVHVALSAGSSRLAAAGSFARLAQNAALGASQARRQPAVFGRLFGRDGAGIPDLPVRLFASAAAKTPCAATVSGADGGYAFYVSGPLVCEGKALKFPVNVYVGLGDSLYGSAVVLGPQRVESSSAAVDVDFDNLEPKVELPDADASAKPTLRGTVLDDARQPVAGARVEVRWSQDRGAPLCELAGIDGAGRYAVRLTTQAACGGRSLQFPTTVYALLKPGPSMVEDGLQYPVYLEGPEAGATLSWGPGGALPAPRSKQRPGSICGSVSVDGRALPTGMVNLAPDWSPWFSEGSRRAAIEPGGNGHTLVRLDQGGFCVHDLAPGNYILSVSPLDFGASLDLAYDGLTGTTTGYRLNVGTDGQTRLFDRTGAPAFPTITVSTVKLNYVPPPAGQDSPLSLLLDFEGAASADLTAQPLLVALTITSGTQLVSDLHWVGGRATQGRLEAALMSPPGIVIALETGPGWAPRSTTPTMEELHVLAQRGVGNLKLSMSVQGQLADIPSRSSTWARKIEVLLSKASTVTGRVLLPGGAPFVPFEGSSPLQGASASSAAQGTSSKERNMVGLIIKDLEGGFTQNAYAASDGSYRFSYVTQGWKRLRHHGLGDAFAYPDFPQEMVWVGTESVVSHDIQLEEPATLVVAEPEQAPLAPNANRTVEIVGVKAGTPMPDSDFLLQFRMLPGVPIVLETDGKGDWIAYPTIGADRTKTFRVVSGDFDVYMEEEQQWPDTSSVRILGAALGVHVPAGAETSVKIPGPYRGTARTSLVGAIRLTRNPPSGALFGDDTALKLFDDLLPRLCVYDDKGAYVATAFTHLGSGNEAMMSLFRLLDQRDGDGLSRLTAAPVRAFRIDGLAEGRYRAVAKAYGYKDRAVDFTLSEGQPTRLEIDMDAP